MRQVFLAAFMLAYTVIIDANGYLPVFVGYGVMPLIAVAIVLLCLGPPNRLACYARVNAPRSRPAGGTYFAAFRNHASPFGLVSQQ